MKYYAGLNVSLKETFLSIVDGGGKGVKEGFAERIAQTLREGDFTTRFK